MKKFTKLCSMLLAVAMVLSLAACNGTPASSPASSPAATDGASASASVSTTSDALELTTEDITLTFWHIWPEGQLLGTIIDDYIKIFEAEHPNIKIEAVATQESEYQNTKLKVATSTGAQGDIFMSWGAGYSKPFVDAGMVLPLDDYFAKTGATEDMLEGALTYSTYDGKAYGLPLKQWAGALFCNQELFDKHGVKVPTTWDELMTAVNTFRSNDVTPMVMGGKDAWHIGMIQNALAVRTAGADYMNKALSGEATFNTPEIVESARLLTELNNAKAFANGTLGLSADETQEEFYMGMVPMYYGGSWVAAGCDNPENALQGKVTVVPMPTIPNGKGDETAYSGGVIDFFMINAKTQHPNEAYAFAEGMTRYMSQECYKGGDSLPAWKLGDIDESMVSPTLIAVKNMVQNSTGYVLAWDTFLSGAAIDAHYQLLQALIAGTVTPEEFAAQMQAAQEEAMGAAK